MKDALHTGFEGGRWGKEQDPETGLEAFLEETARRSQRVYSITRCRSGACEYVDFYAVSGDHLIQIGPEIAEYLGRRYWELRAGLRVPAGCDRARERLVEQLALRLYGNRYLLRHLALV